MNDSVTLEIRGHIADVRLNRPDKRNAINQAVMARLREVAATLAGNRDVRAVVLSGAGGHFSAGLDLDYMMAMQQGQLSGEGGEIGQALAELDDSGANAMQQIAWCWHQLPQPVVAAIDGVCLGIGVDVALGADFRIAHPQAKISLMEVKWGLLPDLSATQSLRRLLPLDQAKMLVMAGCELSGREALQWNLCTETNDKPYQRALELAEQLAALSPDAVQAGKRVMNQSALVDVAEGLRQEAREGAALVGSKNQIEAIMAKLEKRPANFN